MKKFTLQNFLRKMQDPAQRKRFYAIFGGKLLGLAACFLIIFAVSAYLSGSGTKAHAQDATTNATTNAMAAMTNAVAAATGTNAPAAAAAPATPPDPAYCSPINTMWVLVT